MKIDEDEKPLCRLMFKSQSQVLPLAGAHLFNKRPNQVLFKGRLKCCARSETLPWSSGSVARLGQLSHPTLSSGFTMELIVTSTDQKDRMKPTLKILK